ncbi:MAG TPA: HigA family addiction module antitoxin [Arthrobacter sp.]|nr:HigA family addiction module antitoxin [Arthrobacter sp.]
MNTESDTPPQHPGDRLRAELQLRKWPQRILAQIIGRPDQVVSEIVSGKKGITPETALQLGAALDMRPEFWLELQDAYVIHHMEQDGVLQARLAEITRRAESVVLDPPRRGAVYSVKQSEHTGNYIATVDAYPELWAAGGSEHYAVRKLKAMVAAARKRGDFR